VNNPPPHNHPLRLYNSLTRRLEPLVPGDPAAITFYSCGPTVYDDAHIGNFRSFLAADVLRRFIESPLCSLAPPSAKGSTTTDATGTAEHISHHTPLHHGPRKVTHVMNMTDVGHMSDDDQADGGGEDKMEVAGRRLLEAKKAGKLPPGSAETIDPANPNAVADFYAGRFLDDARKLGLKLVLDADADPTLMPRPTRKIPQMLRMIQRLIDNGHAYVGTDGVCYFDTQSFPEYGRLSGNTLDKLRSGAGGRVDAATQSIKKHPADFMLWKPDPHHLMRWDPAKELGAATPLREGYPGWHIECSAMACERLGDVIDLHSGGEDNIFPHHECELAQSCCSTGKPLFARMWFHARFLFVEGEKMSKSKGNFFTARDLFAKGYEPGAVRLELIRTHYRTNANFTEQGLKDSQRMIDRWRRFAEQGAASTDAGDPARSEEYEQRFIAAMHEDLNVAEAVAQINRLVSDVDAPSRADAAALARMDSVLSILERERPASAQTSLGVFLDGLAPDPAVVALLEDRAAARKAKDFKRSDVIRDELAGMGYAIKDVAGGKVEVRRA